MSESELLAEAISEFFERRGRGQDVDIEAFVAEYPSVESALREHLQSSPLFQQAFPSRRAVPEQLGAYRILDRLGSGGMGTVYRAEVLKGMPGLEPGTIVALKVVHPHLLERPGFFQRFLREAEVGRRVDHPNVVRTYNLDAVAVEGRTHHFLVMEYVEGQTLGDLLDRVPEGLVRHIACELARGLEAIHGAGAVHRDLKPENVLITPSHEVKIMDLGVAKLADEVLRLSQTGQFIGSLNYAAPEQIRGTSQVVDHRADLFALGVLLHELLSGQNPFRRGDSRAVLRAILDEAPPPLSTLVPEVTPFAEEVVLALVEKDPRDRISDAPALLNLLDSGESGPWWAARREARRGRGDRLRARIAVSRVTPVWGREAEVEKLRDLYSRAKNGDGQVVLLEGEAGIGKTRLLDHFLDGLQASGEQPRVLFGSCVTARGEGVGGALLQALRDGLREEDLRDALSRYLVSVPGILADFTALLELRSPPDGAATLTPAALQTAVVEIVRAMAEEQVTLVLLDDLHHASGDELELFASLARSVRRHRVLLIGTRRPREADSWWEDLAQHYGGVSLALDRLGPKELLKLVEGALGSKELTKELSYLLASKSDGNPFFALEILESLRERGVIRRRPDGSWDTSDVDLAMEVPSAIEDLISVRLSKLAQEDRDLLEIAACAAFEFDPLLVAAALEQESIDTLRRLASIKREHHLVRASGRRFRFDHHLVQQVLLDAMPVVLREACHGSIADAIEDGLRVRSERGAEEVGEARLSFCQHCLEAGVAERAVPHVMGAIDHLEQGFHGAQSADLAERFLALPDVLVDRARLEVLVRIVAQTGPLARLGDTEKWRRLSEEALRLSRDLGDRAREILVLRHLCTCALDAGDARESLAIARRMEQLARDEDDDALLVAALLRSGIAHSNLGAWDAARTAVEAARAAASGRCDAREEAAACGTLGNIAWELDRLDEARDLHEEALRVAREAQLRDTEANAHGNLGNVYIHMGRPSEARPHYEAQLSISREIGDRAAQARATGSLGIAAAHEGRLDLALDLFQQAHTLILETGHSVDIAYSAVNLAGTWRSLGEFGRARDLYRRALHESRKMGVPVLELSSLLNRSLLESDDDYLEEALHFAEQALERARALGIPHRLIEVLYQIGSIHAMQGHADAARESLEEAKRLAHEHQDAQLNRVVALLATLPGAPLDDVLDLVREHPEGWDFPQGRYLLWQVTGDLEHLRRARMMSAQAIQNAPAEHRESMLNNVRLHREIMEAWAEHGGGEEVQETS